MRGMFQNSPFNQPIGNWDVSAVTDTAYMFASVVTNTSRVAFNQDIGAWNVGSVTDMTAMFGAVGAGSSQFHSFNNGGSATIGAWDVTIAQKRLDHGPPKVPDVPSGIHRH